MRKPTNIRPQARAEEVKSERRRKPGNVAMSGHRLLFDQSLMDEEKFVYRVINDDGQKLQLRTQQDDYELVDDPSKTLKSDGTDLGTKASVIVGRTEGGQPIRGYLARKLRTYHDDDQRQKRERNQQTMEAISAPQIQKDRVYTPTSQNYEDGPGAVSIK